MMIASGCRLLQVPRLAAGELLVVVHGGRVVVGSRAAAEAPAMPGHLPLFSLSVPQLPPLPELVDSSPFRAPFEIFADFRHWPDLRVV